MHYEMHPLWSKISYVSYLPVLTEGNAPFSQLLNNVCCRKSLQKNTLKKILILNSITFVSYLWILQQLQILS